MKKVSVIVPTYNEEDVIEACIQSLSKQTHKNLEAILVDDGSIDSTVQKIQGSKIPNLHLLKQSHKGPGSARNLGASKSKGEILVFVDADMTFEPDFIERLIRPILENKTKGTFSKDEFVGNWENVWARCWNYNKNLPGKRMLPEDYPDTQKVFRAILKSEFEKVNGFSLGGHYTDDWSLSEKLGYEAEAASGAKFYHKNPDSLVEVFTQSRWAAKRKYKLGALGYLVGLFRSSFPVSLIIGVYKSIKYKTPEFLLFKIVYDLGVFLGVFDYAILKKSTK